MSVHPARSGYAGVHITDVWHMCLWNSNHCWTIQHGAQSIPCCRTEAHQLLHCCSCHWQGICLSLGPSKQPLPAYRPKPGVAVSVAYGDIGSNYTIIKQFSPVRVLAWESRILSLASAVLSTFQTASHAESTPGCTCHHQAGKCVHHPLEMADRQCSSQWWQQQE